MINFSYHKINKFGILFSLIFFGLGIYFNLLNKIIAEFIFFSLFTIFLISSFFNFYFLKNLEKAWLFFGNFIGKIISPIILALLFFIIISPIGLILKLFGRDVLSLKPLNKKTYWKTNEDKVNFKDQF
jgi:hypothetical protein